VRLRLTPVDTVFFDLLALSARNLVEGAQLLAEMLHDGNDRTQLAAAMRDAEHRGDEITHDIIRRVNSTFVTPLDREDIYRLAAGLDDVMDFMDAAVDSAVLYQVEELPAGVADLIDTIRRAAQVTADAMPRLRGMRNLDEYWIEINRLEHLGDQMYRKIIATLFNGSNDALTVLKVKDIVDQLEASLDALESVANTVEQIAVKES
jgi:predicted phosphate transport protein (TIGR00153 family)